jgi:hypothetical protein
VRQPPAIPVSSKYINIPFIVRALNLALIARARVSAKTAGRQFLRSSVCDRRRPRPITGSDRHSGGAPDRDRRRRDEDAPRDRQHRAAGRTHGVTTLQHPPYVETLIKIHRNRLPGRVASCRSLGNWLIVAKCKIFVGKTERPVCTAHAVSPPAR